MYTVCKHTSLHAYIHQVVMEIGNLIVRVHEGRSPASTINTRGLVYTVYTYIHTTVHTVTKQGREVSGRPHALYTKLNTDTYIHTTVYTMYTVCMHTSLHAYIHQVVMEIGNLIVRVHVGRSPASTINTRGLVYTVYTYIHTTVYTVTKQGREVSGRPHALYTTLNTDTYIHTYYCVYYVYCMHAYFPTCIYTSSGYGDRQPYSESSCRQVPGKHYKHKRFGDFSKF
jgi:energy-converting hydrogenase Eha subunit G